MASVAWTDGLNRLVWTHHGIRLGAEPDGPEKREIDADGGQLTRDGLLTAPRWIAWLNIGLCVGGQVLALLFFAV